MIRTEIIIDGKRYRLAGMTELSYSTQWCHGTRTSAVWYGPRSHRLIIETDSQWESGRQDGTCVGTQYQAIEPGDDEYGQWIDRLERDGDRLPSAPIPIVNEPAI